MGGGDGDEAGVWIGEDEREGEGEGDFWIGVWGGRDVEGGEGDAGVVLLASLGQCTDGFRVWLCTLRCWRRLSCRLKCLSHRG